MHHQLNGGPDDTLQGRRFDHCGKKKTTMVPMSQKSMARAGQNFFCNAERTVDGQTS